MKKILFLMLGMCITTMHAAETTPYDPKLTAAGNFKKMLVMQIMSAQVPADWPEYDPALTSEQKFKEAQRVLSTWPSLTRCGTLSVADYCAFLSDRYKKEACGAGCITAIVNMVKDLHTNVVSLNACPEISTGDLDGLVRHVRKHVSDEETLKACIKDLSVVRDRLGL